MKRTVALLLAACLLLSAPPHAAAEAQKWDVTFDAKTALLEQSLVESHGLSAVVRQVQFAKGDKLRLYLELHNSGKNTFLVRANYVLLNGWAMERPLFADQNGDVSDSLAVAPNTSVAAYVYVQFSDVPRFDEMKIANVADASLSLTVYKNGALLCEAKGKAENPDAAGYVQTYFDDGETLFDDGRIRVVYQGKDIVSARSAYFVENYRRIDDRPLIYESFLGNTLTDHVDSDLGRACPSTFFLPAYAKRLLWGPDIRAYCQAAGLRLPKTAEIGLLFDNTDPIVAHVEVPGGSDPTETDLRIPDGLLVYQDKNVRLYYTGVYDDGDGGQLMFVMENDNYLYPICLQANSGKGWLDETPVWVAMDYNVAAPESRCVAFAKLYYDDGSAPDLAYCKAFRFSVWPQRKMSAGWVGEGGSASFALWGGG